MHVIAAHSCLDDAVEELLGPELLAGGSGSPIHLLIEMLEG
jgi:hypothetical protein